MHAKGLDKVKYAAPPATAPTRVEVDEDDNFDDDYERFNRVTKRDIIRIKPKVSNTVLIPCLMNISGRPTMPHRETRRQSPQ